METAEQNDARTEGMIDLRLVRELIDLDGQIKAEEVQVKKLKEKRDAVEASLLKQFEETGAQSMNLDGRTVYRHATWRASVPAELRGQAIEALRAIGLGDLVTEGVNAQTLSAQVREWLDAESGEGIPAEIQPLINTYEDRSLRVRAS